MEEKNELVRIALVSAVILFIEMLLIRWIGTEIRITLPEGIPGSS